MLDEWNGKWEETLASYNAGKNHVVEWQTWNSFQEPAEFVETIPFTETREYVQAVLRNAAIYHRLYGTSAAAFYELERGRLRTVLADAVWAAYRRTMSLSESLSAGKEPEPMPPR